MDHSHGVEFLQSEGHLPQHVGGLQVAQYVHAVEIVKQFALSMTRKTLSP